jgi:uncharacterized protein YdeI (YjbR/CyaY-like superfamily)
MAKAHDEGERVQPKTVAEWSDWLATNHTRDRGVWLLSWRKHVSKPSVDYEDAVMEALRYGWVDSRTGVIDEERSGLWFSPRRPGSAWARTNKSRIERLERDGRLEPSGKKLVDAARADGSWNRLDDVDKLVVPKDLTTAFRSHPGSADQWAQFPPGVRRSILEWIVLAKKPETRAGRIDETARLAARGERANQGRPKK